MYPSLYYAVKDLVGIDFGPLKMVQMFGFFVALAFIVSGYLWTKEVKRKEMEGLIGTTTIKTLKGEPASMFDLMSSGVIGFLLGYKLVFILFNFSAFTSNTQAFILSSQGSFIGAILFAVAGVYLKYKEKEKTKLEKPIWVEETMHPYQYIGNLTLIAAFAGLLGAKIFHNLENWDTFIADPKGALLSFDGLTMYGGLICASIACIWYGTKNGIPYKHLIDSAAPSLMIGYGIGRIGCHVSGDGDWGINNITPKPGWLSWAPDWMWSYDYAHNVVNEGVPIDGCIGEKYCTHLVPNVFPTAFYEVIMCLSLFFVIWYIRKKIKTPGMLFSIYLIMNGIERFNIEKIRVNTLYNVNGFKFTQAELISSILFFAGVFGVYYFKKQQKRLDKIAV